MAKASSVVASWKHMVTGPKLAHHIGAMIGDTMYIHGGIAHKDSTAPSNRLFCMDLGVPAWTVCSH